MRDQSRADSAALRNRRPFQPMPALREAALYTFSNTRGTPSRYVGSNERTSGSSVLVSGR